LGASKDHSHTEFNHTENYCPWPLHFFLNAKLVVDYIVFSLLLALLCLHPFTIWPLILDQSCHQVSVLQHQDSTLLEGKNTLLLSIKTEKHRHTQRTQILLVSGS
jgi:hypothetical protein